VQRAPEGEVAAWTQELVCLAIPNDRIEPVPAGRGEDEIECSTLPLPLLERRDQDLEREAGEVAPRLARERFAELDAHDRKARLEEGP